MKKLSEMTYDEHYELVVTLGS